MQATPLPFIAVWDDSLSEYVPVQGNICVASWASSAIGHPAGSLCGDPVFKKVGDAWFCDHHYERALKWHYAENRRQRDEDEEYGWSFEARRYDADAAEVVYYLLRESNGLIKIGTSARFRERQGELRTQYGPLRLLLTHRGDRDCESGMHLRFRDLRVSGEWFRPGKPLMEWILEVRRRQAKIVPPGLLPGTVALSEVVPLVKATRRRVMAAGRKQCLP